MKIKSYILSLWVIAVLLSSQTFAATAWAPPSTKKTIILNNRSYTLNVCDAKEIDSLRLKVIVSVKWKPIATKKRVYTQLKLLQAAWAKSCVLVPTTVTKPQTTTNNNFTVITNTTFLDSLPQSQKNTSIKRAELYTTTAEAIIDNMISYWVLTSADKAVIKGKIELNYVNDCKKIDWLTTVKQRFDSNKKRIKNELVSISLNVSTCEDANFNTLFSTSYKHVFIHELGHYIYYLKDTNTSSFEDICRIDDDSKKPWCISYDTFYSKYAMNDPQEDYAEAFAYWYQNKKPEFNTNWEHINLATLNLKTKHFSDLFGK